ncbi:MAG: sulfatase [Verrucomicrobiales bacterium]|nr:sulfatase [Verrucomicrobiales bacterium]
MKTFLATLLLVLGTAVSDARQPNIIFLLTDDQRWDTLGCYGNDIIHTPNIDALSKRGITFDRAFVTSSICAPNRACILTGQYAARHGMWSFDKTLTPGQLSITYPALLKKSAGYRTGFIGKYGVGKPPGPDVFDFNRGFPGQGKFLMQKNGKTVHLTSVMANQAIEFIDSCSSDQPFNLSVSFKAPHVQDSASVKSDQFPYDPRPEIANLYQNIQIPSPVTATTELYQRWPDFLKHTEARSRWAVRYWSPGRTQQSLKGYYRLISGVDAAVGRIVAKLEKSGHADNTVIIFTSDHGQYLGDYGFAGKWYPHDASVRVPLIIADPRLPQEHHNTRTKDFALSIDLAATMLDLAGAEVPQQIQGRSLVPITRGRRPDDWRSDYYYEHHFVPRPEWNMSLPRNEGIRTARWKYIQYIDSDPLFEELYDLDIDPNETTNIAEDPTQSGRIQAFRTQLVKMRAGVQ